MNPVHELVQNPSTEAQSEGTSVSIWGDLYIAIKLQGRIIDGQATEELLSFCRPFLFKPLTII